MSASHSFQGVSNCYVFKSRLQEYAQKVGLATPVYETIKEGPPHEPSFRSTVIVSDVRYDSLPGFFNRKAAEQSAAEVALLELSRSEEGKAKECISQPVHETGLCKNLLQEYAQKKNYAIPLYECHPTGDKSAMYSCTVEIGGVKYIGGASRTKKEAELKAARTALLAIESDPSNKPTTDHHQTTSYIVVPLKKKVTDPGISHQETAAALKPKKKGNVGKRLKSRFHKRKNQLPQGEPALKVTQGEPALEVTQVEPALEVKEHGVSLMEINSDTIPVCDLGGEGDGQVNQLICPTTTLCEGGSQSGDVLDEVAVVMDGNAGVIDP